MQGKLLFIIIKVFYLIFLFFLEKYFIIILYKFQFKWEKFAIINYVILKVMKKI